METKRCTYCHKLQRIESRVCSRCGRPFERRRSGGGSSWRSSVSLFSLPAASPHHAGHYSGLHPEDQPYQSNKIVTPQRFMQDMREKESLQQEPRHIILPSTQQTPVLNRYRDTSQAPTRRQVPRRRSRRPLAADNTWSGNQETQGTNGRDTERQQISRPFVREVLSATQRFQGAETVGAELTPVPASTEVISATYSQEYELTNIQKKQEYQEDQEQTLEDQPFSIMDDATLLPGELPSSMRETLRAKRKVSSIISTSLIAVSFCILLATSTIVLVLMGNRPTGLHPQLSVTPRTPGVHVLPQLQLSATQDNFGPSAAGVVSSQTITLENTGGGTAVWQESSDQPWLAVSPKSGTFADSENVQVIVNRGKMAPGYYTGHVSFSLPGQENTPSVLNVTMTVAPGPAQVSVSTASLSYSTAQFQIPESQIITISNTGGQPLHWDAAISTQDGASWLTLSLYHGVIPSGVGQPLTVAVASQALPIGTYTGLISFTGDTNARVEVSLTVVTPGNLVISPPSLTFTAQQTNQTLSLRNSGGLSLDWTVTSSANDNGNWLGVATSSGTLAPGESAPIAVHADPTKLSPGSYQGILTFSVGAQTKQVSASLVIGTAATSSNPASATTSTPISASGR